MQEVASACPPCSVPGRRRATLGHLFTPRLRDSDEHRPQSLQRPLTVAGDVVSRPPPPSLRRLNPQQRRSSYFQPRGSISGSSNTFSLHLSSFHKELKKVVRLRAPCTIGCIQSTDNVSDSNLSGSVESSSGNLGLACLQTLVDADNYDELQYQLFISEIQSLNPTLREGCMFVDGLYEFVVSRLPVQVERRGREGKGGGGGGGGGGKGSNLASGARDFLTVHTTDTLLLQRYWHKPHDVDKQTAYLTIASSFVQFVFKEFGPQGVAEFLQHLDYTIDNPLAEGFRFKGYDIVKLEFKWKKFVEAEVNANFRLSVLGMLHMLFTHYLLSHLLHLAIVLVLILADVGLDFLYAIAFAQLISLGFSPGPLEIGLLFQWVSVLIGSLLVRFTVLLTSAGLLVHLAVSVGNKIRGAISARFGLVTPLYLTDHSSSSLLTCFSQDVNIIEKVISTGVRAIVAALILVGTCFVYTAVVVWPMAIYLSCLFVLSQLLNHFVSTRLSVSLFAKGQANGKMCDILKEQIDGFLVCRLYHLEKLWLSQMMSTMKRYYTGQARRAQFFSNFCWFFQQMVPNVSIATMLFGIILLSRAGYTDFTSGISVFLFYIRVSVGLTAAASMFPELQTASAALGRINALLHNKAHDMGRDGGGGDKMNDSQQSNPEMERCLQEPASTGTILSLPISFKGVSFCYKTSAAHWNLYNVSLDVKSGERVALVGTTGSGKSTLLMLAMKLYKPTVGEVIIGGGGKSPFYHGVQKISTTLQNNHMFDMSLRENIRLGNLAASNEEVEEAAKKADIHDWITTLPRGYDTSVQSGGRSLSGGQRQRIAIARMLVAKSPICLLDEVTSALDPVTEKRVFERLMEVTKGHTVLAVTHKLKQAKEFDRIVVMSHGKVKEVGSHQGLLAHRGVYWRMWNNDTSGSPGQPVPIQRPQSSVVLQLEEETPQPPELSIEPLSSSRERVTFTQTPVFLPLPPLLETGESEFSDMSTSLLPPATSEVVPAITTPTIVIDGEPVEIAPLTQENPSNQRPRILHQSSTPLPSSTASKTRAGNTFLESGVPKEQGVDARSLNEQSQQEPPRVIPFEFDANQTMPTALEDQRTAYVAGMMRRHPNIDFTRFATQQGGGGGGDGGNGDKLNETLEHQLEMAMRKEQSVVSLASLFRLDIADIEAKVMERELARKNEEERMRRMEEEEHEERVEGESDSSLETYHPAHC